MNGKTVAYRASATLLMAMLVAAGPIRCAEQREEVDFWLTILHSNDGESDLVNLGSGLDDFGGVARFKTVADGLKSAASHGPWARQGTRWAVIMVSSGDNLLAGPEFNASLDKGAPFYETTAMDLIGYDAVAIGNHDFDLGPDVLADFIGGHQRTRPTYVSSNLDYSREPNLSALFDQGRIARSVVLTRQGENIGVVGATTPSLSFVSSPRNVTVDTDVAGAIQAEVDRLEAMDVNKIILLSHLQGINEDIATAAHITSLDIMVAGGGEELLADPGDRLIPGDERFVFGSYPMVAVGGDGREIIVVTTRGSYGYVGRLVVGFDKHGEVVAIDDGRSGPVRVAGGECGGTLPCDDTAEPDPEVQALVADPVIAHLDDLTHAVIAESEIDLDGWRGSVRSVETNEGNLTADGLLWQATQLAPSFGVAAPDVAIHNGGGIRNDSTIPAGALTKVIIFRIAPFSSFVTVLEHIPRYQFKEILENAVSRIPPAAAPGGTGRFAHVAGFSFAYDATGTPMSIDPEGTVVANGSRVRDVVLKSGAVIVSGGAVVPGPDLTVATTDFLTKGGDQYPFRGAPFTTLGVTCQQALSNYIQHPGGLNGSIRAADYPIGGEGRIVRLR